MPDIRQELYEHYVSTFKTEQLSSNDSAASSYQVWCEYKYLPLFANLGREDPILELGCGPGNMLEYFNGRGFSNVEGLDISEEQVSIAVRRGLKAHKADAFEYLQSRKSDYKAIIAVDFIEHFPKQELLSLLRLIYMSLSEEGVFIIQTPNGQGLFPHQVIYGDLTHYTILTPDSLQQVLRLVGFTRMTFFETGPVPSSMKGLVRLYLWKLVKLMANTIRKIETGKTQELWTENMICYCQK